MKRMHSDNARYLGVVFNKSRPTQLGIKIYAKLADGSIVPASHHPQTALRAIYHPSGRRIVPTQE